MKDLHELPDNLPIPVDDGACNHLLGSRVPSISLNGTSGKSVDLGSVAGTAVIFFYPMNGKPDSPPMIGWNDIPGARGCTPQVCSFRNDYSQLVAMDAKVFGVSSQPLADQKEVRARLALPYELLNDTPLELTRAMNLPTFEYEASIYIKRITVIAIEGVIKKTFYPVFPPDKNVSDVIIWIKQNNASLAQI